MIWLLYLWQKKHSKTTFRIWSPFSFLQKIINAIRFAGPQKEILFIIIISSSFWKNNARNSIILLFEVSLRFHIWLWCMWAYCIMHGAVANNTIRFVVFFLFFLVCVSVSFAYGLFYALCISCHLTILFGFSELGLKAD